jgi:hypothetical protein
MSRYTTVTVKKMKDGEAGHQSVYALKQYGHSVVLDAAQKLFNGPSSSTQVRDREYYIKKAQEAKDAPF